MIDEFSIWTALALVALGLGASTYGVLIGAGGGFIIAPLLILAFGEDHTTAVGTSLMVVFLSVISASIPYLRLGYVPRREAFLFGLVAIPGSILGVIGLRAVAGDSFLTIYGALLFPIGAYIVLKPGKALGNGSTLTAANSAQRHGFGLRRCTITTRNRDTFTFVYSEPLALATNSTFGFLSSFFGMGGGPIRTPALIYLFSFPISIAVATSVVSQVIFTGAGSLAHFFEGNIDFIAVILVGAGAITGAQIAVRLGQVFRGRLIMRLLSIALLGIGAQLILTGTGVI